MGGVGAGREPVQGPPCLGAPLLRPQPAVPQRHPQAPHGLLLACLPSGCWAPAGSCPSLLLPSAHDKELQREHRSSLLQVLRNKRVPVSLRTMPLPHRVAGPSEHQCSPPGPGPKPPLSSSVLAALPPLSCCPFGLAGWRE